MMGGMEHAVLAVILGVTGLIFGSFAGATVWRLRAQQVVEEKAAGELVDADELKRLKPLSKGTFRASDRSRCLHCGHELAWYDLLPLVSWLGLRGKCRYCHVSIGYFEPVIELGVALLFVASYLLWPAPFTGLEVVRFVLWLLAGVALTILFVYDLKWSLFDTRVLWLAIGLAAAFAGLGLLGTTDLAGRLTSLAVAVLILAGLYFLLDKASKGRWVGEGDAKLGLALALLLGKWELAFIALFAANLIGTLVVLPGLLTGKLSRTARVPFGPFLIAGMLVAFFAGTWIVTWFSTLMLW